MNAFGTASLANLSTANSTLQGIAKEVLRIKDHSILKGHRNQIDQDYAHQTGRSKLKWPHGKHNALPSNAIDVQTYPVPIGRDYDETEQLLREDQLYLLGLYAGVAATLGTPVRTGADWDQDGEIADNGFDDFFHVETIE
jgi:hypothetical protein